MKSIEKQSVTEISAHEIHLPLYMKPFLKIFTVIIMFVFLGPAELTSMCQGNVIKLAIIV